MKAHVPHVPVSVTQATDERTPKENTTTFAVVYPLIAIDSQVVSKCVPLVCNPSDCRNHHKASTSSVAKSKVEFPLGSLPMSPF